jgi:Mrp family chromosome partitioning ATPase
MFAREQIRGLVRQIFFASITNPVRQVVFSAAESGTDVGALCRRVGKTLALETNEAIGVVSRNMSIFPEGMREKKSDRNADLASTPLRQVSTRVQSNLWFVPEPWVVVGSQQLVTSLSLYSRLLELRREFEYSIVEGPPAGESSETAALGQLSDGVILVLAAHSTRRATARRIKETLEAAHVRLLGTVLSERTFPIPEAIYRRL